MDRRSFLRGAFAAVVAMGLPPIASLEAVCASVRIRDDFVVCTVSKTIRWEGPPQTEGVTMRDLYAFLREEWDESLKSEGLQSKSFENHPL